MTEPKRPWLLVVIRVDRDAEELISSQLFELGTRGIITLSETEATVELGAYFEAGRPIDDIVNSLQALPGVSATPPEISVREVEDQDWLQKWKEGFEPTEVGRSFLVAPSWKIGPAGSPGRHLIQIDPGMAFGTGTHETTRLCLEAIEQYWKGGKLLDIGTGTGILAIAAALMVPDSEITGIDVDPQAVEVARENVSINAASRGMRRPIAPIEIIEGQPGRFSGQTFDLVVANLTAEVIADLLPGLKGLLAAKGRLVLSGILVELADGLEAMLIATGLRVLERRHSGEWAALVARPNKESWAG
jgi:ribosomal protein L11 methyltransferase